MVESGLGLPLPLVLVIIAKISKVPFIYFHVASEKKGKQSRLNNLTCKSITTILAVGLQRGRRNKCDEMIRVAGS